jgi:hypothetical protein
MKRVKAHGRKSWNNGWQGRAACDRAIERSFRQTKQADIDEQLADMAEEDEQALYPVPMGREEILAELARFDEWIDWCGPLPASLEDEQAELFDLLETAV